MVHNSDIDCVLDICILQVIKSGLKVIPMIQLRVYLSKFEAPQIIFIAIFELSYVENPYKQRKFSRFVKFGILKKYYVCVLNFCQIWFS